MHLCGKRSDQGKQKLKRNIDTSTQETRPNPAPDIHVFGDSHAKFFFRTGFYAGRHRLAAPLRYRVQGQYIPASSVAGFRPGDRKLNVKDTIREALPRVQRMILAFGQVDLELGYYYRLVIKKETVTPDSYVAWLLGIYRDFLSTLIAPGITPGPAVALKGVNLTALAPEPFAAKYIARIIDPEDRDDFRAAKSALLPLVLSEDAQNAMHLDFNTGLAALAEEKGLGYFDLVQETSAKASATPRLGDAYRPADFDHHLVDSVAVRRMHYIAAGKVFGLHAPGRGRKAKEGRGQA